MQALLRINKTNLDLIKSGIKKTEWRAPSLFNKKILFKKNDDGLLDGNKEIKTLKLVNGYSASSDFIIIEVLNIRMVKFMNDIEIKNDNFRALKDQFAIEIKLGNIL